MSCPCARQCSQAYAAHTHAGSAAFSKQVGAKTRPAVLISAARCPARTRPSSARALRHGRPSGNGAGRFSRGKVGLARASLGEAKPAQCEVDGAGAVNQSLLHWPPKRSRPPCAAQWRCGAG